MMKKNNYSVMLADDHILLRDALATLINSFDDYTVCGLANDGDDLLNQLNNGVKPDIILLDLNMPVLDGFDAARWIHANRPEIKILTLTMYDSEIALIRLLQIGVRGFLKKDIHPKELFNALQSVSKEGYYYSHS